MANWYSYWENSSTERQTCLFANLYATNLAYFEPGVNHFLWANWPAPNSLIYGTSVENRKIVEIIFYPIPYLEEHCFLNFPRLRLFVHPVTLLCTRRWSWLWRIGGMILTGNNRSTRRKVVLTPLGFTSHTTVASIAKTNPLMLSSREISVYCEDHT